MRFWFRDFRNKSRPYNRAMRQAGNRQSYSKPDVVFTDRPERKDKKIKNFNERGIPILVYPHSPLPPWWFDGIVECPDFVRCIFVTGEAQKEAAQIILPNIPIENTGFPYLQLEPFMEIRKPKNILFAPIHPSRRGLRPEGIRANRMIQEDLFRLGDGYNITCRALGDLDAQGILPYDGWHWSREKPDGSVKELNNADLVIAEGTYMYMSIAKGIPTIGINQHLKIRMNDDPKHKYPKHWDEYADLFAYPINYDFITPLPELIERACRQEPTAWKRRCMGENLNPNNFSAAVEKYL